MGKLSEMATPDNSDEESGDAFTDGDFDNSDEETVVERLEHPPNSHVPVNETVNSELHKENGHLDKHVSKTNGLDQHPKVNGHKQNENGHCSDAETHCDGEVGAELRRDSHGDQNPSIVGILGDQQNHVCKHYLFIPRFLISEYILSHFYFLTSPIL
jgi:hypothetical protein